MFLTGTNPAKATNTSLSTKSMMYLLALDQYEGYLFSQILYNKTIAPNINSIYYTNRTLLVNIGNIDLNSTQLITLYVDSGKTDYTMYYNFLVSDVNMSAGLHNITVRLENRSMSQKLYVSPMVLTSVLLSHRSGTLSFDLYSPYKNISVSNVSFMAQPQSFDYVNTSFYRLFNMTVPSAMPNSLILLSANVINGTTLSYQAQTQSCAIGTPRIYFLFADTNYGKVNYVIYARCI